MAEIRRVVLAGHGRFGAPITAALHASGFEVTVFTRSKANLTGVPEGVRIQEVDYTSIESLKNALQGQDAVVSMVAMSAIANQTILIDAAIAAGVKHFVPAECSVETRHPSARNAPLLATVIPIQEYLTSKEAEINWFVIGCPPIEFVFDAPFFVDFDHCVALLWDGGDGKLSIGNLRIVANAIASALKQPSRVKDHVIRVQGAAISQNYVLRTAEKYSPKKWSVEQKDATTAVKEYMALLSSGQCPPDQILPSIVNMYAAMTFGNGFFHGEYQDLDNEWLGITETIDDETIEKAIRYRIETGLAAQATGETLSDVEFLKAHGQ